MKEWFEVKARYEKMDESGKVKMTTESYLIEALSFTEAEARGNEELEPYMEGDFEIMAVGRKKYSEVLMSEGDDFFFESVVAMLTLDEKSGTEKAVNTRMLVQSNTLGLALDKVTDLMEDSMIDYRIKSIKETAIIEVLLAKDEFDIFEEKNID